MKTLDSNQQWPPERRFDNALISLILLCMHPLRAKAIRGVAIVVLLLATAGCKTEGETVPVRTAGPLPPAVVEPRPVMVAAVETEAPVKLDKPAAAADVSTNVPAAPTTAEATAKAATELSVTDLTVAASTNAPAITEEIPPARPANLKISEATEKVIKLTESNLDEKVILTFVQQTPTKFELDADEIVYLSDVGLPSTVIAAMLKHDGDDPSKAENITGIASTEDVQPAIPANTNLPPAMAQTLAQPAGVPQPQGQAIEVTTNYVPNQQVVVQQQPQTVVVQQAPTVVYAQPETVTYFYDSLAPYGSWFYVSDYGWCWQPTVAVVDHGWRPYGPRGRWVWTDAGWYWNSDYSWGWAPFHYGRWQVHGSRGWIWVPDRVWGPSWVTWRSYGDYCGWAPLPPHAVFSPGFGFTYYGRGVDVSFGFGLGYDAFCFAPVGRFHNRRVYDYCLPRHEVHRVYAQSHVANHWEYNRGGHAFVNRAGARLETGARPAVVRTMSENDRNRWGNRERVDRTGRENVIYRPPSPPASTAQAANVVGTRRGGNDARGSTPNWSPRTRAEGATRPSTASGIAATPAGQPNAFDSRRNERGSSDRFEGRPQVSSSPAAVSGSAPSVPLNQGQIIDRGGRGERFSGRPLAGSPNPVTTTPAQTAGLPAPSTTTPGATAGLPAPSMSTPGIGTTAGTSSRISTPQTGPPVESRSGSPAGRPEGFDRSTRRPLADAGPATTPLPSTPTFATPPRSTPAAEPVAPRRDFSRSITTPTTPAPNPTTVAPPATTTITPRSISPPPSTTTPRDFNPPVSAPAPTRISPAAPTYSAPAYTPPVSQAPSSRGGDASRAGNPNTISPSRGRGRD